MILGKTVARIYPFFNQDFTQKIFFIRSNASRAKKITSTVASVEVDSSKVDKPPNNISEHEISDEKILPTKNQV